MATGATLGARLLDSSFHFARARPISLGAFFSIFIADCECLQAGLGRTGLVDVPGDTNNPKKARRLARTISVPAPTTTFYGPEYFKYLSALKVLRAGIFLARLLSYQALSNVVKCEGFFAIDHVDKNMTLSSIFRLVPFQLYFYI